MLEDFTLNQDELNTLAEILAISLKVKERKALCIKIGINPQELDFLYHSSDESFATSLVDLLYQIGNTEAICQLCCKELVPIFKNGRRELFLKKISSKLNCNQEFRQNSPNNKQPTSSSSSPAPSVSINPFNQLAKNKLVIGAMGVIMAAFITAGLVKYNQTTTPTPSPTTTSNSSPADSSPTIKITQPSDGSKLLYQNNKFTGTFKNLPANSRIYLYVKPSVDPKYYCYTAEQDTGNSGYWHVDSVSIGGIGNSDSGASYDVSVLALDSKTNKESQSCQGGLKVLTQPSNTIAGDKISLIRQ